MERNPTNEKLMENYLAAEESFRDQGGYELEARVMTVLKGLGFSQAQLIPRPVFFLEDGGCGSNLPNSFAKNLIS